MKYNKKMPPHDLENIMPLLIEQWRRLTGLGGPRDVLQTREFRGVVQAVMEMEDNFALKEDLATDYFSHREHLGAYLLYYWVMHYQEGLSLINELPKTPKRVLDICSGPVPYAFAALQHGADEVYATDRYTEALELGAAICGKSGKTLSIRKWDCLNEHCPVPGKFDLIIFAHALEEVFPSTRKGWKQEQNDFIRSLLEKLNPDGHLLLVDSSRLSTNHRILDIRETLVQAGVPIQAPCIRRGDCPALKSKNSPCYAQREFERPYVVKEIQRAARIKLSSLKMSYLLIKHPKAAWPSLPEKNLYRVTSPLIDGHNGSAFYLCGVEGKKKLLSDITDHPKESRAFNYLKRGELISVTDPVVRNNELYISEETSITIEAACGKSIEDL